MLFKNPVRTSKRTPHFTITKINWLTLFKFEGDTGMLSSNRGVLVVVLSVPQRPDLEDGGFVCYNSLPLFTT
jgi:hypothetical protein